MDEKQKQKDAFENRKLNQEWCHVTLWTHNLVQSKALNDRIARGEQSPFHTLGTTSSTCAPKLGKQKRGAKNTKTRS